MIKHTQELKMMTNEFILTTEKLHTAKIHPLIIFSILDRYLRRSEGQERVIGTLLGHIHENGAVEITNCFPVPHVVQEGEVAVGKEFYTQMAALYDSVNPKKEKVVGWYASSGVSGQSLDEHSCLIHNFFAQICPSPIHLVVDTSCHSTELSVKAFTSSPLTLVKTALTNQFKQIHVETLVSEEEKIALNAMSRPKSTSCETAKLESEIGTLESSMQTLYDLMCRSSDYVEGVLDGTNASPDANIGREIASALMSIPDIRPEAFDQIFNENLQDLLMVAYLSNLTQAQLFISDRLFNI